MVYAALAEEARGDSKGCRSSSERNKADMVARGCAGFPEHWWQFCTVVGCGDRFTQFVFTRPVTHSGGGGGGGDGEGGGEREREKRKKRGESQANVG